MTAPAERARVYTPAGKMAHLLPPADSPNDGYAFSLCRMQPRLFTSWLGTGSQSEYEKAASLPLCGRCSGAAAEADRPFAETASPEDTPAGAPRMLPGRGLNAADETPTRDRLAVNARDAVHAPRAAGISGNPERTGGAAPLPGVPPVLDPADDRPPVSVEGGLEGLSPALARAREAAFDRGDPGSSSRVAKREGNAGPGTRRPGPAQMSSPALQGHAGEANNSAGDARRAASPADGLSGQAFRDAVRAAQTSQARARRTRRGKSSGTVYRPGAARREPPPGAA